MPKPNTAERLLPVARQIAERLWPAGAKLIEGSDFDDVATEALMSFLNHRQERWIRVQPSTALRRIVHDKIVDLLRARKRRLRILTTERLATSINDVVHQSHVADDEGEEARYVLDCLEDRLDRPNGHLLQLFDLDQLDMDDVVDRRIAAQVYQVTPEQLRVLIHRLRKKVASLVHDLGPPSPFRDPQRWIKRYSANDPAKILQHAKNPVQQANAHWAICSRLASRWAGRRTSIPPAIAEEARYHAGQALTICSSINPLPGGLLGQAMARALLAKFDLELDDRRFQTVVADAKATSALAHVRAWEYGRSPFFLQWQLRNCYTDFESAIKGYYRGGDLERARHLLSQVLSLPRPVMHARVSYAQRKPFERIILHWSKIL